MSNLKLDGKPMDLRPARPVLEKAKKELTALPPNQLKSIDEFIKLVQCGRDSVAKMKEELAKEGFVVSTVGRKRLIFGSQKGIKALKVDPKWKPYLNL